MADKTAFLDTAFPAKEHTKLKNSARNLIVQNPKTALPVFKAIAEYISQLHRQISDLQSSLSAAQTAAVKDEESNSPNPGKKRRLDSGGNDDTTSVAPAQDSSESMVPQGTPLATITDISFSVPQRKKFTLVLTSSGIAATVPVTGKVEWSVEWKGIKNITLVPVPEKAVRQLNFIIFPHGGEGVDAASSKLDAAVLTIPETAPKTASGPALTNAAYDATTYESLLTSLFNHNSPTAKVCTPIKAEFQSAVPQPHRKAEAAFHVKAHRGTKEGYLWFLAGGIVWGFKKPLMFVEFVRIDSVSYTSITKRTFNLNIHIHPGSDVGTERKDDGEEVEFAMIDQADYAGIDAYVRKHRLNDASMAEMRRAVVYNVNKPKENGDGEEDANEATSVSDLQKALEQAEDEEEGEDYDPEEDEGDSDGSGEDSEDDDDDDEEEEDEGSEEEEEEDVADLRKELGSELEEVEGGVDDSDEEMSGVAKAIVARRNRRGR